MTNDDIAETAGPDRTPMTLSPRRVLRVLLAVAVAITLGMIVGELSRSFAADDAQALARFLRTVRRYFAPAGEQTVVAWFTASALLAGGLLLFAIGAATRLLGGRFVGRWRLLGAIFVFLSIDEAVAFHEQLGDWVKEVVPTGGPLLWAWVIPYGAFAVVVFVAYVPFLRHLPAGTRRGVLIAGTVFIGGALVLEMIQAAIVDVRGRGGGPVTVLSIVEEAAEMLGAILFLDALLIHLAAGLPVSLAVSAETAGAVEQDAPQGAPAARAAVDAGA
jgi:hypothetical protein